MGDLLLRVWLSSVAVSFVVFWGCLILCLVLMAAGRGSGRACRGSEVAMLAAVVWLGASVLGAVLWAALGAVWGVL